MIYAVEKCCWLAYGLETTVQAYDAIPCFTSYLTTQVSLKAGQEGKRSLVDCGRAYERRDQKRQRCRAVVANAEYHGVSVGLLFFACNDPSCIGIANAIGSHFSYYFPSTSLLRFQLCTSFFPLYTNPFFFELDLALFIVSAILPTRTDDDGTPFHSLAPIQSHSLLVILLQFVN